jgi:hypothetical protein
MARTGVPATEDRQVELARKYRADGSLEAERYRLRVRTCAAAYTLPDAPSGCVARFGQAAGGVLYVLAWPAGLSWLTGSPWGAVAGLVIVAAHLSAHMP